MLRNWNIMILEYKDIGTSRCCNIKILKHRNIGISIHCNIDIRISRYQDIEISDVIR